MINISVYEKGTLGEAVTVRNWVDYGKDETFEMYLNEPFMYIVEGMVYLFSLAPSTIRQRDSYVEIFKIY